MMFNFIVFVVSTYFAITIGLYFKASTFKYELKNKKKAFVAPLYWITLFFFILFSKEAPKNLLVAIIFHPYVTLLSCFVVLANRTETKSRKNTYELVVCAYEKDLAICGASL